MSNNLPPGVTDSTLPRSEDLEWGNLQIWLNCEAIRLDLRADEMKAAIILGLKEYCGEGDE